MTNVRHIDEAAAEKLADEIKRLKFFRGPLADYFTEIALIRKQAFDAHIRAGFTEEQALTLIRDIGDE